MSRNPFATPVLTAATVALGSTVIWAGPATAVTDAQQARACTAVNVVGMTVQTARATLADNGCLPGNAKDGRHFVVRTVCSTEANFGLIVRQRPVGQTLGRKQLLTLWSGVRGTGTDGACTSLPAAENDRFDGRYVGTFTVVTTNTDEYPVGGTLTGITFTVESRVMTGEVTGTINAAGASRDARYNFDGVACDLDGLDMTFGNGIANAPAVRCREGNNVVTGRFAAFVQ